MRGAPALYPTQPNYTKSLSQIITRSMMMTEKPLNIIVLSDTTNTTVLGIDMYVMH